MDAPTVGVPNSDVSVNYGNWIDLDTLIDPNHGASKASYTYAWAESANGTAISFYKNGQHIIYSAEESSGIFKYKPTVTAHLLINGVELTKSATVTFSHDVKILPMKLALTEVDAAFIYNGTVQTFPFQAVVDSTAYDGDTYSLLNNVYNTEKLTRLPYYYDASGNNSNIKYRNGIIAQLVALQFESALNGGTDIFAGDSPVIFKNAGRYYASQISLQYASPTSILGGSANYNKNYIWSILVGLSLIHI